jgi:hypothetical protein
MVDTRGDYQTAFKMELCDEPPDVGDGQRDFLKHADRRAIFATEM